jgi:hypothetical protein
MQKFVLSGAEGADSADSAKWSKGFIYWGLWLILGEISNLQKTVCVESLLRHHII